MSDNEKYGFLTETHREILDGEWEGSESTLRSHKSEIRRRSKGALKDLTKVAGSPHISNESKVDGGRLFEPEEIGAFLTSIVIQGGLMPADYERPSEEYRNRIYVELDKVLRSYHEEDEPSSDGN